MLDPRDVDLPETEWRHRPDTRTQAERREHALAAIQRAFTVDTWSAEQTLPHRIRVAYRITRELARVKNLVEEDQTLAEALTHNWLLPTELRRPLPGRAGVNAVSQGLIAILESAMNDVDLYDQPCFFPMPLSDETEPRLMGAGGLGLMPPEVPWRWRDKTSHEVREDYNPRRDPMLKKWTLAVGEIARYLRVVDMPDDVGRLGLHGLDDVETTRVLWPSQLQLLYWEEVLINRTLERLTKKGIPAVRRGLREEEGMTHAESTVMVKLALALAREQTDTDVEEQRAIMILRLEDFLQRARDTLELKVELAGLKQLSIVQGLSKTDPEDTLSVFASIVKDYDAKDTDRRLTVDTTARIK